MTTVADAPTPAADRRAHSIWSCALFGVVWTGYVYLVQRFWWVTDDAYISFRFARNLARGLGPRYNLGDHTPVEGYSNFLWVLVCAVYEWLHVDLTLWAPLTSAACGTVLLWLVYDRLYRNLKLAVPVALLATASLAWSPPFAVWSTSGLAPVPFALLIFLTFDRLILRPDGPDAVGAGICAVLLSLVRVEGIAWVAVIFALALLSRLISRQFRIRAFAVFGGMAILGFGVYLAWRIWYYGEPISNTAYAKGALSRELLERGWRYVEFNFLTLLTPFLILPGTLLALRLKRIAVGIAVAAMAWAFPAYAVAVTGDYMPMARFLIPGLVFNAILVAWILGDIAGRGRVRTGIATVLGAAIIGIGLLPGWDYHLVPMRVLNEHYYHKKSQTEYQQWVDLKNKARSWRAKGKFLRRYADALMPGEPVSMAIKALGAIGYETDFFLYDAAGLIVPEIAKREITSWDHPPGHDKAVDPRYFARWKYRPTILMSWRFKADPPRVVTQRARSELVIADSGEYRKAVHLHYAPHLVLMRARSTRERDCYLLLLQLVPKSDAEAEWERFDKELRQFMRKGTIQEIS